VKTISNVANTTVVSLTRSLLYQRSNAPGSHLLGALSSGWRGVFSDWRYEVGVSVGVMVGGTGVSVGVGVAGVDGVDVGPASPTGMDNT
jgi:hypothetical protein